MSAFENWQEEQRSIYLYQIVANVESNPTLQKMFFDLAQAAQNQANIWVNEIIKQGSPVPLDYHVDVRTRFVGYLVKQFGPQAMRKVLAAMKVRGMSVYAQAPTEITHKMPATIADIGGRHKGASSGGNIRAAVFGVNDGLLSNASLIMGMAGATPDPHILILTGLAGLLAGAFSMASGEYVSVRSQREIYEYQIGLERAELAEYPQEEAAELALIYQAKGFKKEEAVRFAQTLIADPDRAMDVLTRDELGLNPDELGSPWKAAIFSFLAFAVGAFVPLLPFLFGTGNNLLGISMLLTGVSLFSVGAILSLFTGRDALKSGLRMLLIGAAATTATYLIGKWVGVKIV